MPHKSVPTLPKTGPRPIAECIALGTLADRARALDALDEQIRSSLPAEIARECRLADVRHGRVVFLATSASWATRLRLHEAALLERARTAIGGRIERVAVKVAAASPLPQEPTQRKPLSSTAARHLRAAANSMADPELRAMYLRLASLAMDDESP